MHHAQHVIAGFLTARQLVVLLVLAVAFICLLVGPVLNDVLLNSVSGPANRAAPAVFVIGLGALVTGIVAGVGLLDAVGAGMMVLVLLAALMVHY